MGQKAKWLSLNGYVCVTFHSCMQPFHGITPNHKASLLRTTKNAPEFHSTLRPVNEDVFPAFAITSPFATAYPESSLYLEKVPWLRLVTCLLDFSRFQSPVGRKNCNPPLWIVKTRSEGIGTFDTGVSCVQCSAKRLALHLAEFFPSTVGRSLWQRTWKWRYMTTTLINAVLFFIRQNHNVADSFV